MKYLSVEKRISKQSSSLFITTNGVMERDSSIYVYLIFHDETFWMTQKSIAELFEVNIPAINKHLKNIYEDDELHPISTISKMEIVQIEGNREIGRTIDFYSLDVIIAVGYRVNSKRATKFRQWATQALKQYIQKGYLLNEDLLKNGRPFGRDYFDELLELSYGRSVLRPYY
jgi:hypothetical protein